MWCFGNWPCTTACLTHLVRDHGERQQVEKTKPWSCVAQDGCLHQQQSSRWASHQEIHQCKMSLYCLADSASYNLQGQCNGEKLKITRKKPTASSRHWRCSMGETKHVPSKQLPVALRHRALLKKHSTPWTQTSIFDASLLLTIFRRRWCIHCG